MSEQNWTDIIVTPLDAEGRVRLDSWLSRHVPGVSRTKVQEMIEEGLVRINGVRVNEGKYSITEGERISFALLPPKSSSLEPVSMSLEILYEDESLIVLNKAAGLSVHPGAGDQGPTLVHGLLAHTKQLGRSTHSLDDDEEIVSQRPGIVHRLDKDTTGVLVVAKTDQAHAHLSKQFHDKTNFRQYVALLGGTLPEGEWIRESWLFRDPHDRTRFASIDMNEYHQRRDRAGQDLAGYRYAKTLFKREGVYGPLTLSSIRLYTGRTHQIRIHALDVGAPVVGDQVYRKTTSLNLEGLKPKAKELLGQVNRQMLHAWVLGFSHPVTLSWMQFEAKLPEDFAKIVKVLQE
jgi:23S rRNA pseudouridine1911/1915/1917 synthase